MTLCDTGPMIALIDGGDPHHSRCAQALSTLPPEPLRTTWPCVVEAMYLLGRIKGFEAQDELWGFLSDGLVLLHLADDRELRRMRELMFKYRDLPMDLADASLVAAAESLGTRRILTLDRHFHAYRVDDRESFEVLL